MITELSLIKMMLDNAGIGYDIYIMGTETEIVLYDDIRIIFINDALDYIVNDREE